MKDEDKEYTWEHLDAAACMWEHVLEQLGRVKVNASNPWADYKAAYGMAALRDTVLRHVVTLQNEWAEANENGYEGGSFDWDFVPEYMEKYVTRILT